MAPGAAGDGGELDAHWVKVIRFLCAPLSELPERFADLIGEADEPIVIEES